MRGQICASIKYSVRRKGGANRGLEVELNVPYILSTERRGRRTGQTCGIPLLKDPSFVFLVGKFSFFPDECEPKRDAPCLELKGGIDSPCSPHLLDVTLLPLGPAQYSSILTIHQSCYQDVIYHCRKQAIYRSR